MTILDTDVFTLWTYRHPGVVAHLGRERDDFALTIITRIEALQGRFAFLMKASDGDQLLLAQQRLEHTERGLARFPLLPFDDAAAAEFDRLRQIKMLKKIGRGDLLIAAVARRAGPSSPLATSATSSKYPDCEWRTGRTDRGGIAGLLQ